MGSSTKWNSFDGDISAYVKILESDRMAPLSRAAQLELYPKMQAGDREARDALVQSVLRMCVKLAKQHTGRGVPLDALISVANEAAIKAVDNWNPKFGALSTITHKYVATALVRYIGDQSHEGIYLPIGARKKLRDLEVMDSLTQVGDRPGTSRELAEALGVTSSYALKLLGMRGMRRRQSVEVLTNEPDEDGSALPKGLSLGEAQTAFGQMDEEDQELLGATFGLGGHQVISSRELAAMLGVTTKQLKEFRRDALARLREAMNRASGTEVVNCDWCMRPVPKQRAATGCCSEACRRRAAASRNAIAA